MVKERPDHLVTHSHNDSNPWMTQKSEKKIFAEGQAWPSAKGSLPRAIGQALGKEFCKKKLKTFAEGLTVGPRQNLTGLACRYSVHQNCRGPGPRQRHLCQRVFLCREPQQGTLGKECLCRVPEIWSSAKPQTLDKEVTYLEPISGFHAIDSISRLLHTRLLYELTQQISIIIGDRFLNGPRSADGQKKTYYNTTTNTFRRVDSTK